MKPLFFLTSVKFGVNFPSEAFLATFALETVATCHGFDTSAILCGYGG